MRLALFADIHANREAFTACLDHAGRAGYDRLVLLGDIVGYGADPAWTLDTAMKLVSNGATAVLGNHDEAVVKGRRKTMHSGAQRVIEWTKAVLEPSHIEFLGSLPLRVEDSGCLYVHANAWAPGEWEYITSPFEAARSLAVAKTGLTFCGHVHEPAVYHQGASGRVEYFRPVPGVSIPAGVRRRWLVNAGAVGQPRDGLPAACYVMFDSAHKTITYYRVPYDVNSAAARIRNAGLPELLAARLERGE